MSFEVAKSLRTYYEEFGVGLSFDDVLLRPQYSDIETRKTLDVSTPITVYRTLKIPIISANMDTVTESEMAIAMGKLGGLGVIHRYLTPENQLKEVQKVVMALPDDCPVAAAVGVKNGIIEHIGNLVEAGCNIIVIDVAHGHHTLVMTALSRIANLELISSRDNLPIDIIAGNVATLAGAVCLNSYGATAVKVGIGPGKNCRTRTVTGHGVPQLSAIAEIAANYQVPVIADGGIRTSGDIVKALAFGANAVMCGSIFAGTSETPGELIWQNFDSPAERPMKSYRGMASREANIEFFGNDPEAPEGISTLVPARGSVSEVVTQLVAGIKSGLSYSGCHNIRELQDRAEWIRLTEAGRVESHL